MKRLFLTCCTAAFLFASCNNDKTEGESSSKDSADKAQKMEGNTDKKEQAWIPYDSAAEMKAMMDAGTLGEAHKMMAKGNGTWDAEITMWGYEGGTPMTAKGTSVTSSILDGHYQTSKFSGNMMGMPFQGQSIMGYDNVEKKFVSTWIDNMTTGIMMTSGTWDDASKSMTLSGEVKNGANGLTCKIREVMTMPDDNNQTMAMYGPDRRNGKEYKMMEIKYTRKK